MSRVTGRGGGYPNIQLGVEVRVGDAQGHRRNLSCFVSLIPHIASCFLSPPCE